MSFKLIGGNVSPNADGTHSTPVNEIEWDGNPGPNNSVPQGATGVLLTKDAPRVPGGHYNSNQTIYYHDGNNNNWAPLTVNTYVGPIKYKVTKN